MVKAPNMGGQVRESPQDPRRQALEELSSGTLKRTGTLTFYLPPEDLGQRDLSGWVPSADEDNLVFSSEADVLAHYPTVQKLLHRPATSPPLLRAPTSPPSSSSTR